MAAEMPGRGRTWRHRNILYIMNAYCIAMRVNSLVRRILEVEQDRIQWTNTVGLLERTLQQMNITDNNASMGQLVCQSAESRSVKQDDLFLPSNAQAYINIKVKCPRYRPGVAQRVGSGIALLFHDRGTRRG